MIKRIVLVVAQLFVLPSVVAFGLARSAQAVEVTFERDQRLPIVSINLAIKAGSVNDPIGQSGVTNFVGEMLMRGTQSRTKEQIDLELDQMGAELGFEIRAESMIMRGSVLASQLDPFLRLLTEIVTQPRFPENEIRKLKSELSSSLLNELGRDSALASRRFAPFLFQGHPYGKPTVGTAADLNKLTRAQLMAHYDRIFRERHLLVVGAGDADPAKIQAWADGLGKARPGGEAFAALSKPANAGKRRYLIIDKPDRTEAQVMIGQIGITLTDPQYYPIDVADEAFGGGSFGSRLMKEIRVQRGWSYGAYSGFRVGTQPRSWTLSFQPAIKNAPEATAYALKMLENLHKNGISSDEFASTQTSMLNSIAFQTNTPAKRVENLLLEKTLGLPDGFTKHEAEAIRKVTLDQVNAAVSGFVQPDRVAVMVLGPAKELREPLAKALGVPASEIEVRDYRKEEAR